MEVSRLHHLNDFAILVAQVAVYTILSVLAILINWVHYQEGHCFGLSLFGSIQIYILWVHSLIRLVRFPKKVVFQHD